ncbi:hypothetical protein PGTUg99_026956 [Puccinia graminis f. sp. tritici]|uniref:Uncharacterized protein n=1 Tax=Puccinia graminis f. sp. tritici TaxID=56615 RepID=A0A5B0Q4N4_PUCGR|nr:hypothetical protein PGTUg99_026956 [Puccinia graminis f. sp. tritici]
MTTQLPTDKTKVMTRKRPERRCRLIPAFENIIGVVIWFLHTIYQAAQSDGHPALQPPGLSKIHIIIFNPKSDHTSKTVLTACSLFCYSRNGPICYITRFGYKFVTD